MRKLTNKIIKTTKKTKTEKKAINLRKICIFWKQKPKKKSNKSTKNLHILVHPSFCMQEGIGLLINQ